MSEPVAEVKVEETKECTACPESKAALDACVAKNGEANCGDLIEAHKQCMRDLGFKV